MNHLRQAFERMRRNGLKMNPEKCGFGVLATKFMGFFVHKKGIEVDNKKTKVVLEAVSALTMRLNTKP